MDLTLTAAAAMGLVIGIPIGRALFTSAPRKPEPAAPEPLAPVSYDDPTRDPNWCWAHGMLYPACAGMH